MSKKNIYDSLIQYITENQNQFYRAAFSYVKNREAALDVVQNAVCKALEHYESIQSPEAVASWFYRVVINEALMYLRKEKKYIAWDETESDLLEGSYEEEAYEPKLEIVEHISELPTDMQTVIRLHFFQEKTLKEISDITATNLNTVKSRLYAACRKLGKVLEEENPELITRHTRTLEKKEQALKKREAQLKEKERVLRRKERTLQATSAVMSEAVSKASILTEAMEEQEFLQPWEEGYTEDSYPVTESYDEQERIVDFAPARQGKIIEQELEAAGKRKHSRRRKEETI